MTFYATLAPSSMGSNLHPVTLHAVTTNVQDLHLHKKPQKLRRKDFSPNFKTRTVADSKQRVEDRY